MVPFAQWYHFEPKLHCAKMTHPMITWYNQDDPMNTSDNVTTSTSHDPSVNIENIEGNLNSNAPKATVPPVTYGYLETLKTALVAISIIGTIGLAWKYEAALTPALVVLGSAVGGYFGAQSPNNSKST